MGGHRSALRKSTYVNSTKKDLDPGPSCCEPTVLTTTPPLHYYSGIGAKGQDDALLMMESKSGVDTQRMRLTQRGIAITIVVKPRVIFFQNTLRP